MGFHPLSRLPAPWPRIVDWLVTLAVTIGFVLAFEAEVAKPFRIPSASMEPYLQCSRPAAGCTGSTSDRVLVNRLAYDFGSPRRGQVVVFTAPAKASACGGHDAGTTFVKRLIGLPGEMVREDEQGFIWIERPGSTTWRKLAEPYISGAARRPTPPITDRSGRYRRTSTSCSATTARTPATHAGGEPFPAAASSAP
jgi:signal peptidase I